MEENQQQMKELGAEATQTTNDSETLDIIQELEPPPSLRECILDLTKEIKALRKEPCETKLSVGDIELHSKVSLGEAVKLMQSLIATNQESIDHRIKKSLHLDEGGF